MGEATLDNAFTHAGDITVDLGSQLAISSKTPGVLSGQTQLSGGSVLSPSGVNLLSSGKIEGFGTVQGTYQGETGGLLWVKGGKMTVGEATFDNAFTHAGDITVDLGAAIGHRLEDAGRVERPDPVVRRERAVTVGSESALQWQDRGLWFGARHVPRRGWRAALG